MKSFYRLMLGKGSIHAEKAFAANFIGVDFEIDQDLTSDLPEDWRTFNKKYIPVYLSSHPAKTRIGAGLACGMLWTVSKGFQMGDTVLCPDGTGHYRVGEVIGDYQYASGQELPHRRPVRWLSTSIDREKMSNDLKGSTRSIGTLSNITRYRDEIERLLGKTSTPVLLATDPSVEDAMDFAIERHLEDFLVENWSQTDFGREYDIFKEDGQPFGQQFPTDTGPLDILAISKDKKQLLVIELKKGRPSDAVVAQTMRYMDYVQEVLAEKGQTVNGAIIAHEDDPRIKRALGRVSDVAFYRYELMFKLVKS